MQNILIKGCRAMQRDAVRNLLHTFNKPLNKCKTY